MASNSTENDEEIARALAEDYEFVRMVPLLIDLSFDQRLLSYASNALLSESVQQPLSPPITITLPVEWSNKSSCCQVSRTARKHRDHHNGDGSVASLQKMESSSTHETDNDEQIAWLLHEEYEFVQMFPLFIHPSLDRRLCRSAPNALMKVSVDRPRSPSIPTPLVEGSSNASSYAEVSDNATKDRRHHVDRFVVENGTFAQ